MIGRTYLILGRVSNLPTVWTNVACAWLVCGGVGWQGLLALLAGGSLFYTGGMFINDWLDVAFDREHRPSRPIPAERISRMHVLVVAIILFAGGLAFAVSLGPASLLCATVLLGCILVYTWIHKRSAAGPLVMAACRSVLLLWAGVSAQPERTVPLLAIAIVAYLYITGLSFLARSLHAGRLALGIAILCLCSPLALIGLPAAQARPPSVVAGALLILWLAASLRHVLRHAPRIDACIGGLLSGIILVDLFALLVFVPKNLPTAGVFMICFILTRITQRIIPAT